MLLYFSLLAACGVVFFLTYGILSLLWKDRLAASRRFSALREADTPESRSGIPKPRRPSLLARIFPKGSSGRLNRLADELYLSGIALKAEEFLLLWVCCGIVLPIILRILDVRLMVVMGVVILGSSLPIVLVKLSKAKSQRAFDAQLVDALTIICNSLRAGFSFQTAMDNIAAELPDPISREFRRVSRECHLGMPLEESLGGLVRRSGSEDLELIVSAVVIQRQVGGNLAQVLDNISGTIRSRIKLRGDIKTMTASGTMSGYVIGAMPVIMLVMLMILNPSHVEMFFTTEIGKLLLLLSAVMEAIGFFFVRKIVNVKF
ncbi:Type II secretion system protein (fragment) [uncultured Eubacteriales bacterium]|uniref:Type II secretion system protein n=1 Tax=uncultured Eubacteriales bacterium TaxID=172733 RepID=A0A212JE30_9FIRM